jgi:hypothetical protein
MSDDNDERTAAVAEDVQTSPHELRADAPPLAIREHGHRGQPHPTDPSPCAFNGHRRKEDVSHHVILLSHQRQPIGTGPPKFLDQIRLRRLSERQLVDSSDSESVFSSLGAYGNHASSCRLEGGTDRGRPG